MRDLPDHLWFVLLAAAVAGCSSDGNAGTPDAASDLTAMVDGHAADAAATDLLVDRNLAPDQAVLGCAELALAPLTLHDDYCAVARIAVPDGVEALAIARTEGVFFVLRIDPGDDHTLVVTRHAVVRDGEAGVGQRVLEHAVAGEDAIFAGRFLARSAGGRIAAGYTRFDITGAVVLGRAGGAPQTVTAIGNYDAAFFDEQTVLVNGLSLGDEHEGQGIYVHAPTVTGRRLVEEIGTLSSNLAVGQTMVFAGGAFGTFPQLTNQVYGFRRDELATAIGQGTVLSAANRALVYEGDLGALATDGDDLLVLDHYEDMTSGDKTFGGVSRIAITVVDGAIYPADVVEIVGTTQPTGVFVSRIAADQGWLALLVERAGGEEVLIVAGQK